MADYPTFGQLVGAIDDAVDDLVVDRAVNGAGFGRSFFTTAMPRFQFSHILTPSERDTLQAFYAANKTIPFNLAFQGDGVTYSGLLFEGRPKFTYIGGNRIKADVVLVAV